MVDADGWWVSVDGDPVGAGKAVVEAAGRDHAQGRPPSRPAQGAEVLSAQGGGTYPCELSLI
jgi:hypothetical protein